MKSTYYHSKDYYVTFIETLKRISSMNRPLVENTAYGGLQDHTIMPHMMLPTDIQFLNRMFSFFFCVDAGDFDFEKAKHILVREEPKYLPNIAVFLNRGVVAYGKSTPSESITFSNYPGESSSLEYDWCFFEGYPDEVEDRWGSHLAMLYARIVGHLSRSHLEPPDPFEYVAKVSSGRKSSIRWAKDSQQ